MNFIKELSVYISGNQYFGGSKGLRQEQEDQINGLVGAKNTKRLSEADIILVDLSGITPDVCVELGIISTLGKKVYVFSSDERSVGSTLPFHPKVNSVVNRLTNSKGVQAFSKILEDIEDYSLTVSQ